MVTPNPHRPGRDYTSRTPPAIPPIYLSTTFELDDTSYKDIQGTGGLHETWYSRFNNPTVDAAGDEVARLHGAAGSMMTASGMAAIATTLLTLLRSGDTIVASRQVYGDTDDLLVRDLPALGINVVRVDAFDVAAWEQAVGEHRPSVLYGETMSNPALRLLDIPAVARLAQGCGARLVIDNTFATPFCTRPLQLGADVVVESATKFLAGHSDVIAGAVTFDDIELGEEIQRRLITFGGCLDATRRSWPGEGCGRSGCGWPRRAARRPRWPKSWRTSPASSTSAIRHGPTIPTPALWSTPLCPMLGAPCSVSS